jgi:hypothetical protein
VLPRSSRWAQSILAATCIVIGGLLTFHFAMTFLYVAPRNLVSARADKVIGSYMLPYFDQDWKLFAPDPVKTDPHILVRAKVGDVGHQDRVTPWLDITSPELTRVRGHWFPDRVSRLSAKVAGSLSETAELHEQLKVDRQPQPVSPQETPREKIDEAFARVLATRAARAQWGEEVAEVQIRLVGHIPTPPPFSAAQDESNPQAAQHDLPWWPADSATPADLAAWKEIHR